MWKYIRSKASTRKLLKKEILFIFPYYEAQIKTRGFSPMREN